MLQRNGSQTKEANNLAFLFAGVGTVHAFTRTSWRES